MPRIISVCKLALCLTAMLFVISSCTKKDNYKKIFNDPQLYAKTVKQLSDVMVDNIFAPTIASRNYAYSNLAAYETVAAFNKKYQSLAGQINGLTQVPLPNKDSVHNQGLAAILAYCTVAEAVTFPEGSFKSYTDSLIQLAESEGMPDDELENSINYGRNVGKAIVAWSKKDNYAQTRSAPKYSLNDEPGRWVPTPPGYMQAVEPSWYKIRTMVIDSAAEFKPSPPPPFNMTDSTSKFYIDAKEVMQTGKFLSSEQKQIADFWDCNPYALQVVGHVSMAVKKISPGGHWMNICGIAAKNAKADFAKTVAAYTLTSVAIFDGFVSCWDEKYRSSVVRPETVINKYLDANWQPHLQTPPFPEYTSGHSVISSAASIALSKVFGESFAFNDTSEIEFGIPARNFKSFKHAAGEASISRLYGGIHYRPAIEVGQVQGAKIGTYVAEKLKLMK